jgi:hypothetical protein
MNPVIVTNVLLVITIIAALLLTGNPLALFCLTFLQIQQGPSMTEMQQMMNAGGEPADATGQIGFVHDTDDPD